MRILLSYVGLFILMGKTQETSPQLMANILYVRNGKNNSSGKMKQKVKPMQELKIENKTISPYRMQLDHGRLCWAKKPRWLPDWAFLACFIK